MANENLKKDSNMATVAGAVTDDSNAFIKMMRIDDTTKGLKVMAVGGSVGTVTEVDTGTGLTGGPITTTGTIALDSKLAPMDTLTGNSLKFLRVNAGETAVEYATVAAGGITIGTTTITSGTNTRILYDNSGVVGEYTLTGTGTVVVMAAGPTITGHPTIEGVTSTGATGTGNFVFSTSPTMSSPTVGTQAATDNSTLAASTAFVATAISNAIAGVNSAIAVSAATTGAANTSAWTYNNGVSGIGATFTGPVNTAITIDGITYNSLTQSLLVKDDTQSPSGAFNGIFNFTAVQTAGTGAIFTRRLDYDTPSDMNNTGAIPVVGGTTNALTSWLLTSNITTVGTSPLTYSKFQNSPIAVVSPTLGGTGIANNASSTITVSGSFGTTLTVSGTTSVTLPTSGTLYGTATGSITSSQLITSLSDETGTGSLVFATSPTLVTPLLGTPTSGVLTNCTGLPAASVVAGTLGSGAFFANAFIETNNAVAASGNAATVPVTSSVTTVTNNSAATLTITITTASAVNRQKLVVCILDFSAVAQTITWVNTENSTVIAPTTSNGSTTLPLTVGFMYNTATSKWRCVASA